MLANKLFSSATMVGLSFSLFMTGQAFAFTFTKIADTNDPVFRNFGFYPAINNKGTVVFSANLNADGQATGIYISSGDETTTTIADTNGPFSLFGNAPAINDQGIVAFRANLKTIGSGIYTESDGVITTISESTEPRGIFEDPVINNEGTIAFSASTQGGSAIFISSDGVTTNATDTVNPFNSFNGYTINDTDTVAFSPNLNLGGSGIFTLNTGVMTTIADTSDRFSFLFPPAINNIGTVVFKGVLNQLAGEGIYTVTNGITTTIADNSNSFSFFENPAINDQGTVAFKGVLKAGGLGIFTGPNPVTDKVIAAGDALDDSTVTDLYFSKKGLNNSNQLVFYAKLANGTTGIFLADPESDPFSADPENSQE